MTFPGEDDFLGMAGEGPGTTHPNEPGSQDILDDPAGVLRRQCEEWLATARDLRYNAPWPRSSATPSQVSEALVEARASLDRLEVVYSAVIGLRSATATQARVLEQAADDAWDDRANAERRTARREYEGPRERYAYWELDIRPQRRRARDARDLADYVKAACDRVELAYRGLDGLRRDLAARLTHLRWETSMEQ